jgi:hippurate hydrolase
VHIVWLMGATRLLSENQGAWKGTVVALFQPAEETGEGAHAMIEDGW